MDILLAVLALSLVGTFAGTFTGLVPGIHVNTLATWVISLGALLSAGIGSTFALAPADSLVVLAAFLASAMVAHEFLQIVPSVFLGAPDPDSALTVFPGHRLLQHGRGFDAVVFSAVGTLVGAAAAIALILPLRAVMGPPLNGYLFVEPAIPYILMAIVGVLVLLERGSILPDAPWGTRSLALGIFLLSGVFGLIVLGTPGMGIPPEHTLFPIFTGLFGVSTLIYSLRGGVHRIPAQRTIPLGRALATVRITWSRSLRTFISSLSGALVSFFPGVTGAQATSISNILTRGGASRARSYIYHISAIKISASLFSIMALFTILRGRSGVAVAIYHLFPSVEQWGDPFAPPESMMLILIAMVVSVCLSFFLLLFAGGLTARYAPRIRYRDLSLGVILFLTLLVGLFTGAYGLVVLLIATMIGLLTQVIGVGRVHLMGVLILPVIVFYLSL